MLSINGRSVVLGTILSLTLTLTACGGGEERQQKYLDRAQGHLDDGNYDKARVDIRNVLQINPNNAEAYLLMSEVEEDAQNWRGVLGNLQKSVELDPNNLKANVKLGQFNLLANRLEEAREIADHAFTLDAEDGSVLGLLAAVEFREGNRAGAEEYALESLKYDPGSEMALSALVELYIENRPEEVLAFLDRGVETKPDSTGIQILRIRVLEALNKPDEVIAQYEKLIELQPDVTLYSSKLADFYVAEERLDDAEAMLRAQVAANPERNDLKMLLARFLLMHRSPETAVAELEQMLEEDPENIEIRRALGGQLVFMKETERAEAVYKAVFEFDTTGSASQVARNSLTSLAISREDFEEAQRWVDEALELEPENPEALTNRARLKMLEGDVADAIPDLRMSLRGNPDSIPTLLLLADAQQKNRSVNLALDNYRTVLARQPNNLIALYQSAVILAGQQNYEEAEANIEAILAQQPGNFQAINLLTEILARQERWDDAQMLVDQLAANETTAPLGDTMTARLEVRQGNYDKAIELATAALEQNDQLTSAATVAAQAYAANGDTAGAITFVEDYLERNPESGNLYDVLAQLYINNQEPDKAVAAYKRAIEYSPERIQSYINLARVLQFRGTPDEIIEVYQSGIDANPDNILLKLEMAIRYQLAGDYDKALALLEEAYALNEDSLAVKNNLASLLIDHFPTEANMRRAQQLTFGFEETRSAPLIDTLGWLRYKQGNYPQAINLLVAAQEAGGNGQDYWYHLGMAYYKDGQAELAREQLEKVINEGSPNFHGRAEAQAALESLSESPAAEG